MRRDEAYLLDMLLAARKARQFVAGMTLEEFAASELHQNAVLRPLEIIGEAASRISRETCAAHPEIPWDLMVGMRNRLIHEYFRVKLTVVWETIQQDLPDLIAVLQPLISSHE